MFDGQIDDGQGNLFHPTKQQAKLAASGWRLLTRRKQGCVWIVRWLDSEGDIYNQDAAIRIQHGRDRIQREASRG